MIDGIYLNTLTRVHSEDPKKVKALKKLSRKTLLTNIRVRMLISVELR